MKPAPYTEDTLVQQTTAEYLENQLDWDSVYAYNNEDFGPESLLGRRSDQEVVLTRPLRDKLVQLNRGLPDAAYDDAVRQITSYCGIADHCSHQSGKIQPHARRRTGHFPQ